MQVDLHCWSRRLTSSISNRSSSSSSPLPLAFSAAAAAVAAALTADCVSLLLGEDLDGLVAAIPLGAAGDEPAGVGEAAAGAQANSGARARSVDSAGGVEAAAGAGAGVAGGVASDVVAGGILLSSVAGCGEPPLPLWSWWLLPPAGAGSEGSVVSEAWTAVGEEAVDGEAGGCAAWRWGEGSTQASHLPRARTIEPSEDSSTMSEPVRASMIRSRSGVSMRTRLKAAMTAMAIQPCRRMG